MSLFIKILENTKKDDSKDSMSDLEGVEKSAFEKAAEDAEKYINNHN